MSSYLAPNLIEETIENSFGKPFPVFSYDILDSTNTEAKRRIENGQTGDFLVLADEQTAGRGRLGRSFFSPKGSGLYLSLVLSLKNAAFESLSLTAAAAVAVSNSIEKLTGIVTGIKWVNDLYRDGKKLCGILAEAVNRPDQSGIEAVILGIGINLTPAAYPEELRDIVTSLNVPSLDRSDLVSSICSFLLKYRDLPDNAALMEEYRKRSVVLGKKIRFLQNGLEHYGTALDIGEKGELLVEEDNGNRRSLSTGEITVRLV